MTKPTSIIELRWTTFATLTLCALLLPGCPVTDNYFIDQPSGGSAPIETTGGAPEFGTSGSASVAGGVDVGGSIAGRPPVHPDHMDTNPVGGGGTDPGTGMPDAGAGDAGGSEAGGPSSSVGGSSGSGGQMTSGGRSNGGSASGGSANGGSSSGGSSSGGANAAGAPSIVPQPACDEGVNNKDPCGFSSLQLCYKGCGPDNVGYKQLACQGGTYQETQPGSCTFPTGHDYSCYNVPPSLPTECPSGMPRGGKACSVPACKVCFGNTAFEPKYQDSTGTPKDGYCVCSDAGVWTCGTKPESWPCPGPGCH